MREMEDVPVPFVRSLAREAGWAIHLESVPQATAGWLRGRAPELGIKLLDGVVQHEGARPVIVIGSDDSLEKLVGVLDSLEVTSLAHAVRSTLEAYHQRSFAISFADGGRLELGVRTRIMGILNVTPDSFSDGGRFFEPQAAIEAARRMVEEGADLLDIGGESTRPGADPVPAEEEIRRVLPVIEAIKTKLDVRVSVDTMKTRVAARALEAGADMVNDVSALSDPDMLPLLARTRVPVVIMHMRGSPRTMQRDTHYEDLMSEVTGFLRRTDRKAVAAGISGDKIIVDPGIGFGKSPWGNLQILRELTTLRSLGRPILVGASRKSFIGEVLDLPVTERLEASLAIVALAVWKGAHVIRAHDVAETARVARMIEAIRRP